MRRLWILLPLVCGCTPVGTTTTAPVQAPSLGDDEAENVVLIALDLSGSFQHMMTEEGVGYQFATQVIDRYFRDKIGTGDRLVISQISGTQRSLLWEGRPLDLRKQFPSAEAFRQHLMSRADPGGSLVYEGLKNATSYVLDDPSIKGGRAKVSLFVLSDMLDTGPEGSQAEGYVNHALSEIGLRGGVVGIYYVDQELVVPWRRRLQQLGLRNARVESEIVGMPPLPSFD